MSEQQELHLPAPERLGPVVINARCMLRADGERRVVVVAGLPVHHYSSNDAVAEAYAMVFLAEGGFATQAELARAFCCSARTVRRHQQRYADGGMTGLATRSGWRPGRRRIPTKRRRLIERMQADGLSNREIARRMGITENAIREQVARRTEPPSQRTLALGASSDKQEETASVREEKAEELSCPPAATPTEAPESTCANGVNDDEAEPAAMSLDVDPTDRTLDRLFAAVGFLDDAAPVFGSANAVAGGGVLFALAVLVASGVFRSAHKLYGEIGPAFYGLRTTLLTLLLMALWRIKRPEALEEYDPQMLGRMLGLGRAPEIKTLRRKLTRLSDDGHRTQVITSRWDLENIELAYRMFERWRQENFFKYMRDEFLLDALIDCQVESDDPTRTVPNPARRKLDKEIRGVRAEIANLEQAYGAAAIDNSEGKRPTMRGFKIAHGKIGRELRATRARLTELQARRRGLPQRVEVREVSEGAVIKPATERKHLTNLIKMLAFQAESDLQVLLRPHYARADHEGRTPLHELFRAPADIRVAGSELQVTLHPLSSPHRTLAVQAICDTLNESATLFPGSPLRLRFAVHPPREIGLAFPGPRPKAAPAHVQPSP